jgi:hypothetical protein
MTTKTAKMSSATAIRPSVLNEPQPALVASTTA